ncbi:methylamine utilization protein [Pseudoalteromonas phenolica]|uniref:Methylamine utilization protein n=1 Tax=Pseudoalteromonas phenolica TaxID=161398 RepID=A0A5R9Q128_9GAMM|nr:methylamine utilization protein [Pseudoalteromonas phenolica]TLX46848.1 methylamine utilization protein [Pseudoalteromonas phenolica]
MTRLIISAFLLFSCVFASAKTTIKVVDQLNQPLADAVVSFVLKGEQTRGAMSSTPYVMDQVNKAFLPHVLVVPKGAKVSFPNSDDIRHHVYSFSEAKTFELKLYHGQPKAPLDFSEPGIVVLGCNIHDSMVGYIYVYDDKPAIRTSALGLVTMPYAKEQLEAITIWHARAKIGVERLRTIKIDDLKFVDGNSEIALEVNPPEKRDSFENLFSDSVNEDKL